jgi:hypothetical protein
MSILARCSSIASLSESTCCSKKPCVPKLLTLHHINIFSNKIVNHFFFFLLVIMDNFTYYIIIFSLLYFDAPFIISKLLLRECS